jgi:hypothetical protein
MLDTPDQQLLHRAIRRNKCVLFLGAGFSAEAQSASGKRLPAGSALGAALWEWLGYDIESGLYNAATSPLDKLFDVARKKKGARELLAFLKAHLVIHSYPDWYRQVAYPYWYRIYTTNVDNLIERIFSDVGIARLEAISAIATRYQERDDTLRRLQYVKLNGTLGDCLDDLTFGAKQFGGRSGEYDPWYDHFVRDYSSHATILVGTEVNEPLFWKALVSRQGRSGATSELRLRSFLVSPTISPVVIDSLHEFNVVPVRATAKEFFEYLGTIVGDWPEYEDVIVYANPQYAQFRESLQGDTHGVKALEAFLQAFERVSVTDRPVSYRSSFLLGSAPRWQDLALGLDAFRECTAEAVRNAEVYVEEQSRVGPLVITGHRGAGKSTTLMRVAVNLAAAGHLVFHAWGEDVPEPHIVANALDQLDTRSIIVVDDAEWVGFRLTAFLSELRKLAKPPLVVLALRANTLYFVEDEDDAIEVWTDKLTAVDIEAVIDLLERENSLGAVTGRPRAEIRRLFTDKARKQLLVAMMEVTRNDEFERIMANEYREIADPTLRVTYLVACLATAAGASLSRDQLVAASDMPPARILVALVRDLRQMVVPAAGKGDRLVARHSLVAEAVIERAERRELATAYKRLLSVLAHDMDQGARRGEGRRWFRLYRRVINHDTIYRRFAHDIEEARAIYDSLTRLLSKDSHYWLQYGSLELQNGDLASAALYIASAESLNPTDWYIQNAKGHLLMVQGCRAATLAEALHLRREAEALLRDLIDRHGDESPYPWHTLVSHALDWLEIWKHDAVEKREELALFRALAQEGLEAHPGHDGLEQVFARIERDYLRTAL